MLVTSFDLHFLQAMLSITLVVSPCTEEKSKTCSNVLSCFGSERVKVNICFKIDAQRYKNVLKSFKLKMLRLTLSTQRDMTKKKI